jgi:tRNA1Val (adenine37-N6)-methyltransferase
LLLVDFVKPPFGRVVDFCAGCGVVGLGLLSRDPEASATLVEIQERLAALALRNGADNGLGARVIVRHTDLTEHLSIGEGGGRYDVAVANPPYRLLEDGPASPDSELAIAQHEIKLTLPSLIGTMRWSLKPGGRAALIYPASRVAALLAALAAEGLRPVRARFVHPRADEPANRVLVEANKGARGPLVVEPPLILREGDGYSAEAARILGDA